MSDDDAHRLDRRDQGRLDEQVARREVGGAEPGRAGAERVGQQAPRVLRPGRPTTTSSARRGSPRRSGCSDGAMSLTKAKERAKGSPASRTETAEASHSVTATSPKKASRVAVSQQRRRERRGLHEGRPRQVRREAVVCRAAEHDGDRGHEPALAAQAVDAVQRGAQHPAPVAAPAEGREQAEQARPRLERVGVVEPRAAEDGCTEQRHGEEAGDERGAGSRASVFSSATSSTQVKVPSPTAAGQQAPAVGQGREVGGDAGEPEQPGVQRPERVDDRATPGRGASRRRRARPRATRRRRAAPGCAPSRVRGRARPASTRVSDGRRGRGPRRAASASRGRRRPGPAAAPVGVAQPRLAPQRADGDERDDAGPRPPR